MNKNQRFKELLKAENVRDRTYFMVSDDGLITIPLG